MHQEHVVNKQTNKQTKTNQQNKQQNVYAFSWCEFACAVYVWVNYDIFLRRHCDEMTIVMIFP